MSSKQVDVQLYMCQWQRRHVLRLTTVYINFTRLRLVLDDNYIREQASIAEAEAREAFFDYCSDEYEYMNAAENAFEHGFEVYNDLMFLKKQSVGLTLTGLFHLWEKLIKRFIAAELRKDGAKAEKAAAKWTFDDI